MLKHVEELENNVLGMKAKAWKRRPRRTLKEINT